MSCSGLGAYNFEKNLTSKLTAIINVNNIYIRGFMSKDISVHDQLETALSTRDISLIKKIVIDDHHLESLEVLCATYTSPLNTNLRQTY